MSERDLWLHAGGMHTAGPWHPEIGIEEYPHLSRREQKSLYDEIRNQGGPELLSNVYHPENWGSGDPAWDHHYVARDQDGTIHGILRAHRDYQKMEPKRQAYRDMWVHDVYTGNDAPKGTGSALMQAAAHRAMRDGADFSVQGVVPHASGFYHALGGTRKPNYSSFEWTPEDRDALAMGAPNRKPITPMSGTWTANPTYTPGGSFEENNHLKDPVMPPGADDPVGYGEMFVDRSKRLRTAYEQGRKQAMDWHSPAVGRSQLPGDAKWEVRHKIPADLDYLSDESYDPYHEPGDRPRFAVDPPQPHSKWYHTTPAELQPGDRITPRGGPSPDESYYELGRENRPNHVWLSPNPNTAFLWKDWAGDNSHIYEVHPGDTPQAWGLNQGAGFVAPHATVKRRVGRR